jgi:hypothetical protein
MGVHVLHISPIVSPLSSVPLLLELNQFQAPFRMDVARENIQAFTKAFDGTFYVAGILQAYGQEIPGVL